MTDEENASLVIKEGMAQVLRPFQELLQQLLGPAATEVGLSFGDSAKVWRLKRQLHLLEKVEKMMEGKQIKPVAPRLFFPILEAASIEADDEMQSRWAALLANESVNTESVHPSFIELLKQMSSPDARLLDKFYDWCKSRNTNIVEWWRGKPLLNERENRTVQNLFRLGFIEATYELIPGERYVKIMGGTSQVLTDNPKLKDDYTLTYMAFEFVEACRAPKESSEATTQPRDSGDGILK